MDYLKTVYVDKTQVEELRLRLKRLDVSARKLGWQVCIGRLHPERFELFLEGGNLVRDYPLTPYFVETAENLVKRRQCDDRALSGEAKIGDRAWLRFLQRVISCGR